MKLIFKNNGPTTAFSEWLKQFKDISSSILIEIDPTNEMFVSKSYTEDKTLVRYSKISFKDCGLDIHSIKDDSGKKVESLQDLVGDKRIKVGIFMVLPKFITVVDTFSPVDHYIEFNFSEISDINEFHSQTITFKSKTLKMIVEDCSISEFQEISDDMFFDRVCLKSDPVTVEVTQDTLKNLINISSIFTVDNNRDHMQFYFSKNGDKEVLNVKNPEETSAGRSGSYDYTIGNVTNENGYDLSDVKLNVMRPKVMMAIKNNSEDMSLTISTDTTKSNRLIFENKNTITVIAVIKSVKN